MKKGPKPTQDFAIQLNALQRQFEEKFGVQEKKFEAQEKKFEAQEKKSEERGESRVIEKTSMSSTGYVANLISTSTFTKRILSFLSSSISLPRFTYAYYLTLLERKF